MVFASSKIQRASIWICLASAALAGLVACSLGNSKSVVSVEWPDGDRIYYVERPVSDGYGELWERMREGDDSEVSLASSPNCKRVDVSNVFPVDGARFGMSHICGHSDDAVSEFDPVNGQLAPVARLGSQADVAVRWSGGRTKVLAAACDQLVSVSLAGEQVEGFPPEIDPTRCDGAVARAADPTFVDQGRSVVYLNSANAVEWSSAHNYQSSWQILRIDEFGRDGVQAQPKVVQDGIVDARALAVNRAGTALAFCGSVEGTMGLWQRSLGPGQKPALVAKSDCWDVAFSPDGRSVVAVADGRVVFFDL